jgi:methylated-DNA-[protein]-cysteine S-methyltransferase
MLHQYPEAREQRPPPNVKIAIEGISALLRGARSELSGVALDMTGIHPFNQRVYELTREIPHSETRSCGEVASRLGAPSAAHSVARAVAQNPFVIIVPCHRVLGTGGDADRISPNAGVISRRRLLSIEGAVNPGSKSLFDVLLPVAPLRPQG